MFILITSIQYNAESPGQKFQARKVNKVVQVGKEVKLYQLGMFMVPVIP